MQQLCNVLYIKKFETEVHITQQNNVFANILQFLFRSLIVWQLIFFCNKSDNKNFYVFSSNAMKCSELKNEIDCLPKAYNSSLKFAGLQTNDTIVYVVCPFVIL